jgi:hypothetical protein
MAGPTFTYGVTCPECKTLVPVQFRAVTVDEQASDGRVGYRLNLTQAGPMVCECGFTHPVEVGAGEPE